jgi:hypothetical protein
MRTRRTASAAMIAALPLALAGCASEFSFKSGEIDPRASAAAGSAIGAAFGGPVGATLGDLAGYALGAGALAYGAHARGRLRGITNGTTATPGVQAARAQ